jgi:hypothetical protein
MKKLTVFFIVLSISIGSVCLYAEQAALSLSGNYYFSNDDSYKKFYGDKNFLPEGKISLSFTDNLYIWCSYGMFSQKGESSGLKAPLTCTRQFLNFGAGFRVKVLKPLLFFMEGGGVMAGFKEEREGSDRDDSDSKFGIMANAGFRVMVLKNFFIHMSAGYIMAKLDNEKFKVDLGGIKIGGGLGVVF